MSLPDSITTITVVGNYLTSDGEPATGSVSFTPSITAVTDETLLPMTPLRIELEDGLVSVDLAATDDPDFMVTGFTYRVDERIRGARSRSYSIEVPAGTPGGTLDLATVAPVVAATALSRYLLVSSNLADVGDAATARTNLGLGDSATRNVGTTSDTVAQGSHTHNGGGGSVDWDEITGKPSTFPPDTHNHDDRYYTEAETDTEIGDAVSTHSADTTAVHGIADTSVLETTSGATTKVSTHAAATDPHGDRAYTDTVASGKANTSHSHAGTDITSGTVATARLDTGTGGTQVALGNHNHDSAYAASSHSHAQSDVTNLTTDLAGKASTSHNHAGTDITSGTVATARLDTGTGGTQVALGNHNHNGTYAAASHTHAAADTTSGSFDIARIPTGTSSSTVSLGNHSHLGSNASITLTGNVTTFHGTPTVYDRGDGWITADGGIESNGTNNAGSTLVTVPSGYRPSATKQFTMRHTGTSASTGTITLNTDGTITYNSSFASGAQMDLTGVQWRKA